MTEVGASGAEGRAPVEEAVDRFVGQLYRYVLAWTGDRAEAVELAGQVLRGASVSAERLATGGPEVEVWLLGRAREAVARWRSAAEADAEGEGAASEAERREPGAAAPGPDDHGEATEARAGAADAEPSLPEAVATLDDGHREVVVLRLLLGLPVERAARLLDREPREVEDLQRAACAALWRRLNQAPPEQAVSTWDALTVAVALRQAAPDWLAAPDAAIAAHLRAQLAGKRHDGGPGSPAAPPTATAKGAPGGWRTRTPRFGRALRRGWGLAAVGAAALGTIAALQVGHATQPPGCGRGGSCPAPTSDQRVANTVRMLTTVPSGSGTVRPPTSSTLPRAGMGFSSGIPGTTVSAGTVPPTSAAFTTATSPGPTRTSRPADRTTTTRRQSTTSTSRPQGTTTTTKPGPTTITLPTTTGPATHDTVR